MVIHASSEPHGDEERILPCGVSSLLKDVALDRKWVSFLVGMTPATQPTSSDSRSFAALDVACRLLLESGS
jgi:hypothetical protein